MVEFSFYLGFPVQQIAEREYLLLAKTAKYFFLVSFPLYNFKVMLCITDNAASST